MNNDFLLCVAVKITGLSDKHHDKHYRHPKKLVHRCITYVAHYLKIQQHCPVKDLIDPAETGPACM